MKDPKDWAAHYAREVLFDTKPMIFISATGRMVGDPPRFQVLPSPRKPSPEARDLVVKVVPQTHVIIYDETVPFPDADYERLENLVLKKMGLRREKK